ncbi:hypothetical protein C8J57DRAFT_1537802 [Mycena rebaudengoi]|nr:hypothetical protein C8J57DRAFT_1537802 [Mycena rebaudengoi]
MSNRLTLDVTSLREEVESLNADVLPVTSASTKATDTLTKTKERLFKHKIVRANLQSEYDGLSAQKDDLEERLAEAELQVNEAASAAAAHTDAITELRAKYKQVKKEKAALQEVEYSDVYECVEVLETAAASAGSVEDEPTEALEMLAMEAQMEELERQNTAPEGKL